MITTTEYGQNLVKYIYFNSYVVIKILLRYDYFKKIPHPLFRYLGNFDRICIFLQGNELFWTGSCKFELVEDGLSGSE